MTMEEVEAILRECAAAIRNSQRKTLESCFETGKELLKARDTLRQWGGNDHEGKWIKWVESDVRMSIMQARRYVWVYERYGQHTQMGVLAFEVTFRVLATLAAPHADPAAVVEVEKELKEGKKLTLVEVTKRVPSQKRPAAVYRKTAGRSWTKYRKDVEYEKLSRGNYQPRLEPTEQPSL